MEQVVESCEVELKDLKPRMILCDLADRPVYLELALGNGTQFNILLVLHEEEVKGESYFVTGDGMDRMAHLPSVGPSVLWVSPQFKPAHPFALRGRRPLIDPAYVSEKLKLAAGDAPQMAYLIASLRAVAQGPDVEIADSPGFERWCIQYADGWAASEQGRLPEPVADVLCGQEVD